MPPQEVAERKYFGTDGIRDRVGHGAMTPEFMLKLGWAIGMASSDKGHLIVVGKDTRVSGYMFESALEAGISSAGMDIHLLGPLPTPAVSYMTRTMNAACGIVISASHNSFQDNGVKLLSPSGAKLSKEEELKVEHWIERDLKVVPSEQLGKAYRIDDCGGRYIEFCKRATTRDFNLQGVRIALDCANGATYNTAPKVYSELGAEVVTINDAPDGFNINRDCGALHPGALCRAVAEHKADIGIGLDGDGDRLLMVDRHGRQYGGDELLAVILDYRLRAGVFSGGIVGTPMTNLGLERMAKEREVDFVRAQVGDPYVLDELHKRGWVLGGESSGHIICTDKMITADAIIASLEVCEALADRAFDLSVADRLMTMYPSKMINVSCKNGVSRKSREELQQMQDEADRALGDDGRVVVRASGTEPCVRILVEAKTDDLCVDWAQRLADKLDEETGGQPVAGN